MKNQSAADFEEIRFWKKLMETVGDRLERLRTRILLWNNTLKQKFLLSFAFVKFLIEFYLSKEANWDESSDISAIRFYSYFQFPKSFSNNKKDFLLILTSTIAIIF